MLIPDINLLVYAYNSDAPDHSAAKRWWEDALSGDRAVGLSWLVLLGFMRIMTSRRVLIRPLPVSTAVGHIRSWLAHSPAQVLHPGPRHLEILERLAAESRVTGEHTTDLHLAALAIEHQAELHSNDTDFARFPGLRWFNPLSK